MFNHTLLLPTDEILPPNLYTHYVLPFPITHLCVFLDGVTPFLLQVFPELIYKDRAPIVNRWIGHSMLIVIVVIIMIIM